MIKNKRKVIKHTLCAAALCLVMGMGITSLADDKGTVTVASAKIRASADSSSEQLGSVELGGNVDIISETTGTDGNTWYQVYVDANTKGFIRADLVNKSGTGTITTITTTTTTTEQTATASDQSTTEATPVDSKTCTVSQNSVRIRKGASTSHDVVATANRGMTLTITGEATGTDGKLWYQVTFTYNSKEVTGFIRSDLVSFDEVSADSAVSEITGEAGADTSTETQTEDAAADSDEAQSSDSSTQGVVLMNVDETPYVLPGFSSVSLSWNDESIKAYSNGGFYLFYAQMEDGEEGWYIFDSEKGDYQRYVYTASSSATVPSSTQSVGIVPVIILVVIIIILVAAIGLLLIKLKDASSDGFDDDSDDSDDSDDLEFEEIEPRRPQNPQQRQQRPNPNNTQGRRPQNPQQRPQNPNGQNAQGRRPQNPNGQNAANAQGRRPQNPNGQNGQNAQGRRPQNPNGQNAANAQGRRPQNPNGQNAQGRRPQNPQQRPQNQNVSNITDAPQGYKAKAILDNQDDDMDFIDI